MSLSKSTSHVKQQKQHEKKQRQPQAQKLPNTPGQNTSQHTAIDELSVPYMDSEAFSTDSIPLALSDTDGRAKVASLIRQAYVEENLSDKQVADITCSLEEFSRLCYHLIFNAKQTC